MKTLRAYILPLCVIMISGGGYYYVLSLHTLNEASQASANHTLLVDASHTQAQATHDIAHLPHEATTNEATPPTSLAQSTKSASTPLQATSSSTSNNLAQDSITSKQANLLESTPSKDAPPIASAPANLIQDNHEANKMANTASISPSSKAPSIQPQTAHTQATPSPKQTLATYYANATSINIRAIPNLSGRIIGKLLLGQSALISDIQGEWAQLDSGGWVSIRLLALTEPHEHIYTVLTNLKIRARPASNANAIGTIFKGQRVRIQQFHNEWAQLDSGGWVSAEFIAPL